MKVKSEERAGYYVDSGEGVVALALKYIEDQWWSAGSPCLVDPTAGRLGCKASADYLKLRLSQYPYEVFACLFLDNRHCVIAFEELFKGTVDGCSVYPREVVRACIKHNAAAVIFAHNHPSGNPDPSPADRAITLRLKDALALIDVRVLDHFVIGKGDPVSLASRGWI